MDEDKLRRAIRAEIEAERRARKAKTRVISLYALSIMFLFFGALFVGIFAPGLFGLMGGDAWRLILPYASPFVVIALIFAGAGYLAGRGRSARR